MELHKLKPDDIRGMDADRVNELESDIRREIVNVRMDIYASKAQNVNRVRGLKRGLARMLTIKSEQAKLAGK